MKKYLLAFIISAALSILIPLAFWLLGARFEDIRTFIDYLTMAGASFFLIGMITSLAATSRWHYYRHIRKKAKGEVSDDEKFEKDEKKRKVQMWYGIMITVSGVIAFALSGYLAFKIGAI